MPSRCSVNLSPPRLIQPRGTRLLQPLALRVFPTPSKPSPCPSHPLAAAPHSSPSPEKARADRMTLTQPITPSTDVIDENPWACLTNCVCPGFPVCPGGLSVLSPADPLPQWVTFVPGGKEVSELFICRTIKNEHYLWPG